MTAQITEIRPGVRETGSVTHIDEKEKNWRHGVVRHVQAQIPTFRHEQSIPVSQVSPLDSQTVKQTGAVLPEEIKLDEGLTGSDVIHFVGRVHEPVTGIQRWIRWIGGRFGKRLTETRREQLEKARNSNKVKGDYEDPAA